MLCEMDPSYRKGPLGSEEKDLPWIINEGLQHTRQLKKVSTDKFIVTSSVFLKLPVSSAQPRTQAHFLN